MIFWTLAIIAFIIVEAVTTQFVSIWFAGGAFAALITMLSGCGIWIQIIVFVVVSALLLMCTQNVVRKLKSKSEFKTNTEALIGQNAVVIEEIINIAEKGSVKLRGIEWSARSLDGSRIASGNYVTVKKIDGVKLIVDKIEEE